MNVAIWANKDSDYNRLNNHAILGGQFAPVRGGQFTPEMRGSVCAGKRGSICPEFPYYSGTNKLKRVLDPVASGNYADDIDNQSTTENYKYDEIGNLTRDVSEEIDTIFWNVYGKISKIKRTPSSTKPDLEFYYTPDGHRSVKIVIPKATPHLKLYTYYSRDAQGNILAVYNRTINKIINYDILTFAGVNDSLYKITGTAAFGGFIASLFPNNSDLASYLADCASDSSRIDDVLDNLDLSSYCLLSGRLDSVCNNIDNTDLAIAGINYLNENGETSNFLNTLCSNSYDFTNYLGSLEFEKYIRALSSRDVSGFIQLFEQLSLTTYTDNEVAVNWLVTNSSWGAVKTWLEINWHNYNECSEKTNILILIENYTDYLQSFLVDNGPLTLLRLSFDDEQLLNAISSSVPNLNSIIQGTFNHSTLANWYQTNEKNNFNSVVAKLMPGRVGPWQTINSTDTMETYFAQISSYFGQSVHDQLISKFYNASSYFVDSLNATEWHIYGSSRLGIYQKLVNMAWVQFQAAVSGGQFQSITGATLNTSETDYSFNPLIRGSKHYEISNHLGNVLAVVSDMKLFTCHQYDKFVGFDDNPNIAGIWNSRDAWQGQNAVIGLSNGKLHIEESITADPHVRVNYMTAKHLPPNQTYKISFDLEQVIGDHDWQIGVVCANTDSTYESTFTYFSGSSGHNEITIRPTGHIWRIRILHWPAAQNMEYYLDNFRIENLSLDSNLIAKADVISANDYYPFGAPMSQRTFNSSQYRFSFNGKEKLDETYEDGNEYDFGNRIYSLRLAKWISLDPLQKNYPGITPYNYSLNMPTMLYDPDGRDFRKATTTGNGVKTITIETTVHLYGPDAERLSEQISGFQSSGKVTIDGKSCLVVINVKYVVNQNIKPQAGAHENTNKMPPNASEFAGVGVKPGDNIMYVDEKLKMGVNGQTIIGGNSGRIKMLSKETLIHESLHKLGFGERYSVPIIDGEMLPFSMTDPGFSGDYLSNDQYRNSFSDVHLFDMAKFSLSRSDGAISNPSPDNTGEIENHLIESIESVNGKKSSVSNSNFKVNSPEKKSTGPTSPSKSIKHK